MITRDEYEKLCDEIWEHNRLYFQESAPIISDEHYDKLLRKLEEIENAHPDWISATSPTQRIGEKPLEGFQDVVHSKPMLSLEKAFSKEELTEFALGRKYTIYDRSIDVHISNLRNKLGESPAKEPWIKTVRGFGYMFQN